MKFGRQFIFAAFGAVVLVGCQQAGNLSTASRQRWAGEFDQVAARGGILKLDCLKQTAQQLSNMSAADVKKCMTKTMASSSSSADSMKANMSRGRMFYSDTTYTTYLYLPYYYDSGYSGSNTNYSSSYGSSSTGGNSELLCKLLFGKSCWRDDWYSTYFGYQPQQNYQYYNPTCSRWLSTGYNQNYSDLSLGSQLYNPGQYGNWNNSYYGCYNVY